MTKCNFLDLFHGDNRENVPDFARLKSEGILGVFHKATQGLGYVDPHYHERHAAAIKAGMPWGAYAFLTNEDGAKQAAHFWAVAQLGKGERAAADYEKSGATTPKIGNLIDFVTATDDLLAPLGPKLTVIYSSDLIRETVSPQLSVAGMLAEHDLWLAEYGAKERVPLPWKVARLWQYSETGVVGGISGKVDTNYFDGDGFPDYWGLEAPPSLVASVPETAPVS